MNLDIILKLKNTLYLSFYTTKDGSFLQDKNSFDRHQSYNKVGHNT